jgi:hypothetical protein
MGHLVNQYWKALRRRIGMKHVLLDKAHEYEAKRDEDALMNCSYDSQKGYWVNNDSGKPVITDPAAQKPKTKKADVETGEDKKGE